MKCDALDVHADSTFVLLQVLKMQKAVAQCLIGGFELGGRKLCYSLIFNFHLQAGCVVVCKCVYSSAQQGIQKRA